MAEWSKAQHWKCCIGATLSWVQIPLSPPFLCSKTGGVPHFCPIFSCRTFSRAALYPDTCLERRIGGGAGKCRIIQSGFSHFELKYTCKNSKSVLYCLLNKCRTTMTPPSKQTFSAGIMKAPDATTRQVAFYEAGHCLFGDSCFRTWFEPMKTTSTIVPQRIGTYPK